MDNRTLDRHSIPDGKVYFRKLNGFSFLNRYRGPYNLMDLSKSSIRFEHNTKSLNDTNIELKIIVPGSHNFRIKGKVAGPLDTKNYNNDHIIVHFLPFGSRKVYNTYRSKKKLDALLDDITN